MGTNLSTTIPDSTQEVLVRTRASDAASLQRGSATPIPEEITARFAPQQPSEEDLGAHHPSHIKLILALLMLAAIGVGIYLIVIPYLNQQAAAL